MNNNNNYSMSPSWIWSDKITNERVARVGYNHFISNKGEWNNCFSKFSNRVLPPIFFFQNFTKRPERACNFRSHAPRLPPSPDYYITKSWMEVTNLWRKPSSNYLTGQLQEESVQSLERFSIWRKTPTIMAQIVGVFQPIKKLEMQ